MFVSVSFPVKVSHFTMFFIAYKKVEYETKCFSLTPHVSSTHKKQHATVSNNR